MPLNNDLYNDTCPLGNMATYRSDVLCIEDVVEIAQLIVILL